MIRSQSLKIVLASSMVLVSFGVVPAQAALPVDLGDFRIDFTTNAPNDESEPIQSCLINSVITTDQTAIGIAMLTLQGQNKIACALKMTDTSTIGVDRATVTNELLGLTGTAIVICDSKQLTTLDYLFGYKYVDLEPTMSMRYTDFSVSGMRNCTWTMNFDDSKNSTLVGSLTGPIASENVFDEINDTFNVTLSDSGSTSVTGGTGLFAGVSGSSTFIRSTVISMPAEVSLDGGPLSSRNSPQPFADEIEPPLMFNDMVLTASKGGGVKIVSPPLVTSSKRIFGVVAGKSHKIRLVTSPGASCNVFAKIGTKSIKLTSQPLVAKTGVLTTSFTAAIVAGKFGLKKPATYKNKKGQITATCNAGLKKKNVTASVAFTFANS